jgi:hypothetical protein
MQVKLFIKGLINNIYTKNNVMKLD